MKLLHDKYVDDCKDHEFNSEYFKIVLDDMTREADVDIKALQRKLRENGAVL